MTEVTVIKAIHFISVCGVVGTFEVAIKSTNWETTRIAAAYRKTI
jgi:hypothetical protein